MKVYIIDYKTVGAEGVREIEKGVEGDAIFFVTGDTSKLPVQITSMLEETKPQPAKPETKNPAAEPEKPKAESAKSEEKKAKAAPAKPEAEPGKSVAEPKKPKINPEVLKEARAAFAKQTSQEQPVEKKAEPKKKAKLSDELKKKVKEAVKPAGLKAIEYARLYKAFAESADKNEYNIALSKGFKAQKKANDIYKLTKSVFEESKGI